MKRKLIAASVAGVLLGCSALLVQAGEVGKQPGVDQAGKQVAPRQDENIVIIVTLRNERILGIQFGNEIPIQGELLFSFLREARRRVAGGEVGEFEIPMPVLCSVPVPDQPPRCCTRTSGSSGVVETPRNIKAGPNTGMPRFQAPGGSSPENGYPCSQVVPYG